MVIAYADAGRAPIPQPQPVSVLAAVPHGRGPRMTSSLCSPSPVERLLRGLVALLLVAGLTSPAWASDEAVSPELRLTQMTFVANRGDSTEIVLDSERVLLRTGADIAHLQQVEGELGGRDPDTGFRLTCDRAELNLTTHDFRAEGSVVGLTGDGRRLSTDWLVYDGEKRIVSTEAPVKIVEGNRTLSGRGFRYYVDDGRLRLLGGARVVQDQ